jgi:cysteine sulfinate desulfinase/cysteine desulfurase-like protein
LGPNPLCEKTAVKATVNKSANRWVQITPSIPNNRGRIRIAGIKTALADFFILLLGCADSDLVFDFVLM